MNCQPCCGIEISHRERVQDANQRLVPAHLPSSTISKELDQPRQRDSTVNASSHDENVLELFQRRLTRRWLYLFDEHGAPLSPIRQLALLALLQKTIGASQSRFVIVNHSPILMAFPGATIYSLDSRTLRRVARDDLEHVALTRDLLNDPDIYLLRMAE